MSSGGSSEGGAGTPALSLLRVLARRWTHIAIAMGACLVLGLLVGFLSPATYESSARVFLDTSAAASSGADPTKVVQTEADLAVSSQAFDLIGKSVKSGGSPIGADYASSHVTALPADAGYFFTITATGSSQDSADKLVTAAITAYKQVVAGVGDDTNVSALQAQRKTLDGQLAKLDPDDPDYNNIQNARSQINSQIANAMAAHAVALTNIRFTEAPVAAGKIAPKPFVNGLVGLLIGFLASVAVIWVRYLRQPTVLDGRAAADAIGAPLIVGGGKTTPSIDTLVSAVAAVLSPTAKVVALTAASTGDLTPDTVSGLAASWSDDQGVVLVLDASPGSEVRAALERLPRATSSGLPSWAHEPTCLARASGNGRGQVLYNRVSPSRASRPGGLAPILADRSRDVDLVLLLTPPLTDLPMTAASALQADAVVVITSPSSRTDELATVPRDWPALSDRIVGVVHGDRTGFRPSTVTPESRAERRSTGGSSERSRSRDRYDDGGAAEPTDRYVRQRY